MARWFRRDKSVNEARDYLRATDSVSRPTAAVLSIATIIILAIFFFLVFMLLRWGYNQIFNDSDTVVVAPTTEQTGSTNNIDGTGQLEFPGFVDDTTETSLSSSSDQAPQSTPATSVPSTGPSGQISTIPDTGPGSSE